MTTGGWLLIFVVISASVVAASPTFQDFPCAPCAYATNLIPVGNSSSYVMWFASANSGNKAIYSIQSGTYDLTRHDIAPWVVSGPGTLGPDNALWYMAADTTITETTAAMLRFDLVTYTLSSYAFGHVVILTQGNINENSGVVTGADGAIWGTYWTNYMTQLNYIIRFNVTSDTWQIFDATAFDPQYVGIAAGGDSAVWFSPSLTQNLDRISLPDYTITALTGPPTPNGQTIFPMFSTNTMLWSSLTVIEDPPPSGPYYLVGLSLIDYTFSVYPHALADTLGPDNAIWFSDRDDTTPCGTLYRFDLMCHTIDNYSLPIDVAHVLTLAPDNTLWATSSLEVGLGCQMTVQVPATPRCTLSPSTGPTQLPTRNPTALPTVVPTPAPSSAPTVLPTLLPSATPTVLPTSNPTTISPSPRPTMSPTVSRAPTTQSPTAVPTASLAPTTLSPSTSPTTLLPTRRPSPSPSTSPSNHPSPAPSTSPSNSPSTSPSNAPSPSPTLSLPSPGPTVAPSPTPTVSTLRAATASKRTHVIEIAAGSVGGGLLLILLLAYCCPVAAAAVPSRRERRGSRARDTEYRSVPLVEMARGL